MSRVVVLWLATSLVVLLVWLDEGIIATAIPKITDRFDSLVDVSWYASSYLFALSAFQLSFGRVYKDFATTRTYLIYIFVLEMGSLI